MTRQHAPATLRNREAILGVLREELPPRGIVLEVASGTGEHAVFFAGQLPQLDWQPSDPDPQALASIRAYAGEYPGANLRPPIALDAVDPAGWSIGGADAVVCINMVHISPWAATEGLFAGAASILPPGAPLILYGPYLEDGVETAASNIAFNASLKARNPDWGLREVAALDRLAERSGFTRSACHAMPANNLTLVYRRA